MWSRFDFWWMAGVMLLSIVLSVSPAYGFLGYFLGRALADTLMGEN